MRPILVTGFTPFAGLADNPSAIVVDHLAAHGVPGVGGAPRRRARGGGPARPAPRGGRAPGARAWRSPRA